MLRSIPCSVLIPKAKLEQFPTAFACCLAKIRDAFGGYTFANGHFQGSWVDRATGVVHDDLSLSLWTSIPDGQTSIDELKTIAATTARDLREQCLFLSIGDRETIFVWGG